MGAILSGISSFALWIVAQFAARIGIRLALIAVVVACFVTVYGLLAAAVAGLLSLIPNSGMTNAILQFFPDTNAVSIAGSAFWGSLLVKKSWEYWRSALSIAVQVGA